MVNLNIYENVLSKWKIINNNVISVARVINNLLNPDYEEQITWTLTDDENNQFTTTINGLRTIRDNMWNRIRDGVGRTIITYDSSEYENIRIGRAKSLKVSGVLSGYMSSPDTNSEHVPELNGVHLSARKDNLMDPSVKNRFGINVGKPGTHSESVFHVDGHLVYYNNNNNQYDIELPDADLPILVTSATNTNVDIKAGQMCVMDDPNELLSNGTFDTGIDGWDCVANRGNIEWDDTNKRLKFTNTTPDKWNVLRCEEFRRIMPGVKYKLTIEITYDTATSALFYTPNKTTYPLKEGVNEIIFTAPDKLQESFYWIYNSTVASDGQEKVLYVDNVSLKQLEPEFVTAREDIPKGSNLYLGNYGLEGFNQGSRQDFVGLEVWIENISDRDFVYPYGDVQNQLSTYKSDLPITQVQAFTDADIYSKYGVWQEDGAKKGRGYQWSTLTDEQKNILLSDKRNNIFMGKDGELYQVRYRRRTIKGYGNLWEQVDADNMSGNAYKSTLGYVYYYGLVTKFIDTQPDNDVNIWSGTVNHYFSALNSYANNIKPYTIGMFYGLDLKSYMLPIALIQRRNKGIYHPQYNPYGSAKIYYDTNNKSLTWDEVQKLDPNYIKSPVDCINADKISVTDGNGNYDNLTNQPTWYITGTIESGVSGRPDGLYCDTVYERDIEDKRLGIQLKTDREIYEEYKGKLNSGNFRFPVTIPILNKIAHKPINYSFGNYTYVNGEWLYIYYEWFNIGKSRMKSAQSRDYVYIYNNNDNYGIANIIGTQLTSHTTAFTHKSRVIGNLQIRNNKYIPLETGYTLSPDYTINYKINSKGLITELYGDPRLLSERIEHTIESTSTNIDIKTNMYILCNDATNNNGTAGHVYRYLGSTITNVEDNGTDGTANANDGHIDLSDTSVWLDLGDINSAAGLIELNNYSRGFNLFNMSDTNSFNNINYPYNVLDKSSNSITIELIKFFKDSNNILEVFVRDNNGIYVEITKDNNSDIYYTVNNLKNTITIYFNNINNLSYNNIEEAIDKTMIMINYIAISTPEGLPEIASGNFYRILSDNNVINTTFAEHNKLLWSSLSHPMVGTRFIDKVSSSKFINYPSVTMSKYYPGQYNQNSIVNYNNTNTNLYNTIDDRIAVTYHQALTRIKNKGYKYLTTFYQEWEVDPGNQITPPYNYVKTDSLAIYMRWISTNKGNIGHAGGIHYRLPYLFMDREFKY